MRNHEATGEVRRWVKLGMEIRCRGARGEVRASVWGRESGDVKKGVSDGRQGEVRGEHGKGKHRKVRETNKKVE